MREGGRGNGKTERGEVGGSMEKDKEGENGKYLIKPIVLQSMDAIIYLDHTCKMFL